jgi:hypothetical protein
LRTDQKKIAVKEYKENISVDDIVLELRNIEKMDEFYPFVVPCLGFYAGIPQDDII